MLKPRLLVLLAALLWSTAGAAIKLCALNEWQIAGGRSLVAAITLFLLFRSARRVPDLRTVWVAVANAATVVLFVVANKWTTAANAIFLQDTAPLYVLLAGPFLLGEKPTKSQLISAPIFIGGLLLFFMDKLDAGQRLGNAIALLSGVAFALCIIGLRWVRDGAGSAAAWGNLIAAVVALPLGLDGPAPRPLDLALILYLGIFQLGLAYALFARGLRDVPAVEASLLVLLEPVLNPIWTFLLAGERPGPWALAGGALILGATVWRTVQPLRLRASP
jgi:drug/metabolite transporter (DMT)-like permease